MLEIQNFNICQFVENNWKHKGLCWVYCEWYYISSCERCGFFLFQLYVEKGAAVFMGHVMSLATVGRVKNKGWHLDHLRCNHSSQVPCCVEARTLYTVLGPWLKQGTFHPLVEASNYRVFEFLAWSKNLPFLVEGTYSNTKAPRFTFDVAECKLPEPQLQLQPQSATALITHVVTALSLPSAWLLRLANDLIVKRARP